MKNSRGRDLNLSIWIFVHWAAAKGKQRSTTWIITFLIIPFFIIHLQRYKEHGITIAKVLNYTFLRVCNFMMMESWLILTCKTKVASLAWYIDLFFEIFLLKTNFWIWYFKSLHMKYAMIWNVDFEDFPI